MKKLKLALACLCFTASSFAQKQVRTKADLALDSSRSIFGVQARNFSRKGKFYANWGYNVSGYGKSDVRFYGLGYDFTLKNVSAHDRPTPLSTTYFDITRLSIPQFNVHLGYYFKDNYSISLGWDHMKYVMDVPQTVKISGYINATISEPAIPTTGYAGNYTNADFTVNPDFLKYEHTDGYNFASLEVERHDDAWKSANGKKFLTMETGLGAGLLVPRTDVRLFGVGQNNYWNIAGWGMSAKVGAQLFFNKQLFFQSSLKGGWTNLSSIRTTGRPSDHAQQQITFLENYWVLGYVF